jgi:DNA-directed RNA polymerase subunit beta'
MGHIELAAPVVHIWYLRGTRSWLAYLLMGTEAREELKAKQLEKVIYFAANLVRSVDEEKRHEDLPNLEAELLEERDAIARRRELAIDRRFKELEEEWPTSRPRAPRSPSSRPPAAADKDVADPRAVRRELDARAAAFDEFRDLTPARSSTTRCCGVSCATATASTSRAAWAPTPSRR